MGGRDSYRAFGRVTGEYYFDADADFHPHRRSVEWIWRDDNGAERAPFYARNFRRQSAYRLDPNRIDWDALESVVIDPNAERPVASARPHVLIIDEINRANISKVFGELITLLEIDKRLGCKNEVRVRLPYSGTSFGVPATRFLPGSTTRSKLTLRPSCGSPAPYTGTLMRQECDRNALEQWSSRKPDQPTEDLEACDVRSGRPELAQGSNASAPPHILRMTRLKGNATDAHFAVSSQAQASNANVRGE